MNSEWFYTWFETEEYLNVYQHRNEAEAEDLVNLILRNISLPGSAKILDMACGTGRHSILFAKKGYSVTAVDLSKNMLSVAQEKAYSENLNINFIQSDLRHFNYSEKFNLILNLFTSFGYFENDDDNLGILKLAYNHLMKNGYFILDYFNGYFLEQNLIRESVDPINNSEIIQRRRIDGNRVIKEITIKDNGYSKNYLESVRMYYAEELNNMLTEIGFAIEKTFGDFQGSNFDKILSNRIILLARKCN